MRGSPSADSPNTGLAGVEHTRAIADARKTMPQRDNRRRIKLVS
jgi:hypothetical protein